MTENGAGAPPVFDQKAIVGEVVNGLRSIFSAVLDDDVFCPLVIKSTKAVTVNARIPAVRVNIVIQHHEGDIAMHQQCMLSKGTIWLRGEERTSKAIFDCITENSSVLSLPKR